MFTPKDTCKAADLWFTSWTVWRTHMYETDWAQKTSETQGISTWCSSRMYSQQYCTYHTAIKQGNWLLQTYVAHDLVFKYSVSCTFFWNWNQSAWFCQYFVTQLSTGEIFFFFFPNWSPTLKNSVWHFGSKYCVQLALLDMKKNALPNHLLYTS